VNPAAILVAIVKTWSGGHYPNPATTLASKLSAIQPHWAGDNYVTEGHQATSNRYHRTDRESLSAQHRPWHRKWYHIVDIAASSVL